MLSKQSVTTLATGGEVKADLYREANAYCLAQKKQLMPVSTETRDGDPRRYQAASAELQFRCLAAGDPQLGRPTMQAVPDVNIEVKQK